MTHEIKILPKYFDAVMSGAKNFEIRKNDRDYKVGDTLILKEWDCGKFTGRELERVVGYIYYGDGTYGLSEGHCVMALKQGEKMSRYIDTDDFNKRIKPYDTDDIIDRALYNFAYEKMMNTPTADVRENVHGEWVERKVIEDGKAIEEWQSAKCSVCGKYHTTPYMYYFDHYNYCPHCGAVMGERRENERMG